MPTVRLALRAAGLILRKKRADPILDYDIASTDYDDFFSRIMGVHGVGALDEVAIRPGFDVIELACGTGHLTAETARRLNGSGSIRASDMSNGMLTVARKRMDQFPDVRVQMDQGDMLAYVSAQPSASADLVVCGWAICYTKPVKLLQEIARVLRPGGQVVLIETRADALSALRKGMEAVLATDPSMMTRMVHVSLPKGPATLRRWFDQAGLTTRTLREGEQVLPWETADQAVEWVERSGAAAGFRDAVSAERQPELREKLRAELGRRLVEDPSLRFRHSFVVGIAQRSDVGHQRTGAS